MLTSEDNSFEDLLKADAIEQLLTLYFKHVQVSSWYEPRVSMRVELLTPI